MAADQGEFSFGCPPAESSADGLARWRAAFESTRRELALKLGLPLGRNVEVWLRDGLRLRGRLRLHERPLVLPEQKEYALELEVDRIVFRQSEIESCVVADD